MPTRFVWGVVLATAIAFAFPAALRADAQQSYEQGIAAHARGDLIAAMESLQQAADQGHVGAMVRLAYLLDKAEQDEAAFSLYARAAESGNGEAALAVGVMYANGEGVAKDAKAALAWIRKGAESGHEPAMVVLAQIHLRGDLGVPANPEIARDWLNKALAAGYAPAAKELELMQAQPRAKSAQ